MPHIIPLRQIGRLTVFVQTSDSDDAPPLALAVIKSPNPSQIESTFVLKT